MVLKKVLQSTSDGWLRDDILQNAELVYLSLGSNRGDRRKHLASGIEKLSGKPGIIVQRISSLYETEPWGKVDQPEFLNCALEIFTELAPEELLMVLRSIERSAGRRPGIAKWAPRVLDMDILIYGKLVIDSPELTIPHPRLIDRRFVLEPLCELCPDLVLPGQGIDICSALSQCKDNEAVRKLSGEWLV